MAINLLIQEFRGPSRLQVARQLLTRTSAVFLIFYIILVFAVVATLFFFNRQLQTLNNRNSALTGEINALRETEGTLLFLKNRAKLAKNVFAQSSSDEIVGKVVALVSPGIEITEVTSEDEAFLITLRAPNSQNLVSFLQILKEQDFETVILSSLNQTGAGGYLISLEIK